MTNDLNRVKWIIVMKEKDASGIHILKQVFAPDRASAIQQISQKHDMADVIGVYPESERKAAFAAAIRG